MTDKGRSGRLYWAHSANGAGVSHPLDVHLRSVAELAERNASGSPWAAEARLAGLLHDLGKYGDLFQARLRGEAGGLDHWSIGAWSALSGHRAVAAALAIQGHHVGLQAGNKDALRRLNPDSLQNNHPLRLTLSDDDIGRLKRRAKEDGLYFEPPDSLAVSSWEHVVAAMLDVRMLFSCLVDADFLDTEAHFN